MNQNKNPLRIAFFPSVDRKSGNPYWKILAQGLMNKGVRFVEDSPHIFNFQWLIKNRRAIDILHIHYYQPFYRFTKETTRISSFARYILTFLLAKLLSYEIIYTFHNSEPTFRVSPIWLDKLGQKFIIWVSDKIIVHCQFARKILECNFGRKKNIFEVYHPNYIDYYPNHYSSSESRKRLNIPRNKFIFSFFGGIRPNKGIEILIKAFKRIKSSNDLLLIAGGQSKPPEYLDDLKALAKQDDRIIFHVQDIPDSDVQIFLNASDVVVLPFSKILTSGSTILALSFGKPVIVPDKGCLPELLSGGGGWIFKSNDIESLLETMNYAKNQQLNQIGLEAHQNISKNTFENFIYKTINVYLS